MMAIPVITVWGQTSTSVDAKRAYLYSRTRLIDSLTLQVDQLIYEKQRAGDKIAKLEDKIRTQEIELKRLTDNNIKLKSDLEESMGDSLQSSHTSSILFIFNIIVAVILLVALIWIFMRKKESNTKGNGAYGTAENNDVKLEMIEKLGNLRDKGLLTDEEFNLQKRQLFGDKI
jgi:hypothetical protein